MHSTTDIAIRGHRRRLLPLAAIAAVLAAGMLYGQTGTSEKAASKYVSLGSAPPGWQLVLHAHGDRLQKPGKERMALTGQVVLNGGAPAKIQIVRDLPNSVRYQEEGGPTIVFNGQRYASASGNLSKKDDDLIETLAYDAPEEFLYVPTRGLPVRKIGSGFRMKDQSGKAVGGAAYDIYSVVDSVQQPDKNKQQTKFYLINSDTHLVERVRYTDAGNSSIGVEIILSDWTVVSNNSVARTIRRLENGVEVLRFTIDAAALGATAADSLFDRP